MPQVYIVLFDDAKNVLVARKNVTCSFWQGRETGKPTAVNGGGKYAFPGGGLDFGTRPATGALKEFHEETGNPSTNVTRFVKSSKVVEYKNKKGTKVLYYVLFCQLDSAGLRVLAATSTIHIRSGYVYDKELASVEIVSLDRAQEIFNDPKEPDTGWFCQVAKDIGKL